MESLTFPPSEIYNPQHSGNKDFDLIILWCLSKNQYCTWSDFISSPLKIKQATLSNYLNKLISLGLVKKIKRATYEITEKGRNNFIELREKSDKSHSNIRFPPQLVIMKRNYFDIILWMLFNNESLFWSDFINPPLNINQSSLSKNMNLLFENNYANKINREYRITDTGKANYENMLKKYELDKQSLLEEKSKRIKSQTKRTLELFRRYNINDEDLKYRFVNLKLLLDYNKVKSILPNEDDFDRILLFFSYNHPNQFPNYISPEEFSKEYGVPLQELNHYVWKIVEQNLYSVKFFKIQEDTKKVYYFHAGEKLENILSTITDYHVSKSHFLEQLNSGFNNLLQSSQLAVLITKIIDECEGFLFKKALSSAFREFLPSYLEYLAYKFEKSNRFTKGTPNLGELIWKNIPNILENEMQEENIDPNQEIPENNIEQFSIDPRLYQILEIFQLKLEDFLFCGDFSVIWNSFELKENIILFKSLFLKEDYDEILELIESKRRNFSPITLKIINICINIHERNFTETKTNLTSLEKTLSSNHTFLIPFLKSFILFSENKLIDSLKELKLSIEICQDPNNSNIFSLLKILFLQEIQILFHLNKFQETKEKIHSTMKVPNIDKKLLLRLYLLIALFHKKKTIKTDSIYKLFKSLPIDPELSILKAIYFASIDKYEKARIIIEEEISLDWTKQFPYIERIVIFLQSIWFLENKKYEKAENFGRQLEMKYPHHPQSYIARGLYHAYKYTFYENKSELDSQRFIDFFEYASHLEHLQFNKYTYLLFKSKVQARAKKYKDALFSLDSARKIYPTNYELLVNRSFYKVKIGEGANAIKDMINLMQKNSDHSIKLVVIIMKIYNWMEHFQEAINYVKSQLPKYEDDTPLKNHLVYCYLNIDDKKNALKYAKEIVNSKPHEGAYIDTYGEILLLMEKYQLAKLEFEKALEIDPYGWYIYESKIKIGICNLNLGKLDLALQYLKEGVEDFTFLHPDKNNKWVEQAKKKIKEIS